MSANGQAIRDAIVTLGEYSAAVAGHQGLALTLPRRAYEALVLHLGPFVEYGQERLPQAFERPGLRFVWPKPEHIAIMTAAGEVRVYEAEREVAA